MPHPNSITLYLNRRTITIGMLAAGTQIAAGLSPSSGSVLREQIRLGAYDPEGYFADKTDYSIEHIFLPWEDVAISSLFDADRYAFERNRTLMVTLEPWTWSTSERNTANALLTNISRGAHDTTMRSICEVLASLHSPLILRWGHEMDNDNGQFIWANWPPDKYISAYRWMAEIAREMVPNMNLMWSPLGTDGMEVYYPGDDYVDLIGLSVFGLQAWDHANYNRDQSFAEIFAPRYDRAVKFGKPIIVAELGFSGDAAYVTSWDNQLRHLVDRFPSLIGLVYFNNPEVYDWPQGFGRPDWRIEKRIITIAD